MKQWMWIVLGVLVVVGWIAKQIYNGIMALGG